MTNRPESSNPYPENIDLEKEHYDRRQFLKTATVSVAAFAAANYMLTDQVMAQIVSGEHNEADHQTYSEDTGAVSEIQLGINVSTPTAQDIELMNSGQFDFNVLWAAHMQNVMPHKNHKEEDQFTESVTNFNQVKQSAPVYVAIPSQLPDWYASFEHAPDDVSINSPLADYYRLGFERYKNADFILPQNEPDLAFKADKDLAPIKAAQMMITADMVAQEIGYKGVLLGPASSDTIGNYGADFLDLYINYLNFVGYVFKTETAIAVHSYHGIKENNAYGVHFANSIAKNKYNSDNKKIYLPETGNVFKTVATNVPYVFDYSKSPPLIVQEVLQAKHMIEMYRKFRNIGVAAVANYTYYDQQVKWQCGYYSYTGKPHLIYYLRDRLRN